MLVRKKKKVSLAFSLVCRCAVGERTFSVQKLRPEYQTPAILLIQIHPEHEFECQCVLPAVAQLDPARATECCCLPGESL